MNNARQDPRLIQRLVYPPPLVAWGIVAALFVAYLFSFIDRMLIGLLVEPIKADLSITDTEISLLQGLAFAIFYTVAGLPIGRLIDRSRRVGIIAAGVALWSFMTALCAWAGSFWHFFLIRMGVGVGEATLSPAAYSIISDSFPRRRLGLAMGVYGLGSAIGAGVAFLVGAAVIGLLSNAESVHIPILGEYRVWQVAFLVVGVPGFLVAALFHFLPEPVRLDSTTNPAALEPVSLSEVWSFVRRQAPLLIGLILAASMVNLGLQGAIAWLPAMFMRVHALDISSAGYVVGSALIVGGLIGLIGGGFAGDWHKGGSSAGRLQVCALATAFGVIGAVLFPLAESVAAAWFGFVLFFAAAAVTIGAAPSILQQVVPNRMRGVLSASYLFCITAIGVGLGPTVMAGLSDLFFVSAGGIRYAMAIICPASYLCALALFVWSMRKARSAEGGERAD